MALGAQRSNVLSLVFLQAMKLAAAGTLLGVIASLAMARVLKSLIFNVSPTDPMTFAVVGFMVITVALIACYIPARRATAADPMNALRAE
jgi:ABC-type lipoprotein release transport system permease subunit